MSQNTLRVLFCIGVNQNFFDATPAEAKQVWGAFGVMMKGMEETPGIRVIGNMDDDQLMVGPSTTAPWTTYVLADADTLENVAAVCNLFRTTPVGESKLWKYCKIEARVGRELIIQG
ncbi:IacB protein [Escherichia fergusonii]|uniref:IacB protein n=1 Tax=Escherichia fergusonii TaxID=564 RepID=UPI0015EFD6F4|nr:IacB protein [Escherichia fergusonii]MBZ4078068.1 IacB protein [Escherichia fergusonii]MBZ4109821.1 IacB protein [Escherichia fergusonii]MBZ4111503.1 IacB protein [Escherichia fergusonii]MBZ4122765.1 IacB protein [Escherichia fergusonii]MBZ4128075.1 IacB protein [Escherichia fergusonii]